MATKPRQPPGEPLPTALPAADVIVDVEVERGALHLTLANTGDGHAHGVRVRFSRVIRDIAGTRVNDNPLFTQLEFLAAGRRIRLFVDTLAGYAARRQPARFLAGIEWRDDAGRRLRRRLTHDVEAHSRLRETL